MKEMYVRNMRSNKQSGFGYHYEHFFPRNDLFQIFSGILLWLEKEGAIIHKMDGNTIINAEHGSARELSVWQRDAKKKMTFNLKEDRDGILVSVEIRLSLVYFDDIGGMESEISIRFEAWLNELWAFLEGGTSREKLRRYDAQRKQYLISGKKMIERELRRSGALAVIGLAIWVGIAALWQIASSTWAMVLAFAFIGCMCAMMVVGIYLLLIINNYFRTIRELNKIERWERNREGV